RVHTSRRAGKRAWVQPVGSAASGGGPRGTRDVREQTAGRVGVARSEDVPASLRTGERAPRQVSVHASARGTGCQRGPRRPAGRAPDRLARQTQTGTRRTGRRPEAGGRVRLVGALLFALPRRVRPQHSGSRSSAERGTP